ncbi:MAG TPA: undecaprenyldiphospho-muramoylpentapeptide beta-N-acetylglucosaminyltransferase [Methylomusa anaerophila]|uniref:UDP-N-acetylglucosamine--N-acetylmuramyl-(pentapeptide) pyrophosphoryl-undecaprenol N-acetylglucosamine transferase n=1 Tax=Methylomusa anaerophila TaxID=1930071 RepID=A0A348AQB3_9FIRM|nr:undecaprenyldiphospho-muramoylpentapeptide beta-N-acetylglucosaminyltransferase [Methylomusa anaerophila]BBB93261.1 UDP-N-acetylglucosamine--N-acetylmuramyl-(pentapeptide) pyrophosphoryl-undecaprenol N-acetylglucosamine transferase [Methylomusa anaerophila]HML86907.1 undecaprenyldiphospho-muramoylpentapeptide beta-N-acetylglucosaminyltransferase [Methylomusa anaerophila]
MRVIISGGGTGGHIYPAVTIAKEIVKMTGSCQVLFIGTKGGLEADIIPKEGFSFQTIEVRGLERRLSFRNVQTIIKTVSSLWQSLAIIRSFRPSVVVGTGGYVCGPVLLAASILKIPTVIQEQNVIPGITNRILARFVDRIAVGYQEAAIHFKYAQRKVVFTGNPIRPEVMSATRSEGQAVFGLDPDKLTLLVVGGSQGARSINTAMLQVHKHFANNPHVQILHVTGQNEYNNIVNSIEQAGIDLSSTGNIIIKPYIYNMPQALAAADLAVFRAGAVGLAEITARGIPAILIPYPYASENHQEYNARVLEKQGAAITINDSELDGSKLLGAIENLLNVREKLDRMGVNSKKLGRSQAAQAIARLVLSLATYNRQ